MTAEYAGIPMPIKDEQLIVEPSHPLAQVLMGKGPQPDNDGWVKRNSWYSRSKQCEIILMEKDGRIDWGFVPGVHHVTMDMHTMACADVWGLEQEAQATETLSGLVTARQLRQYLLTGMFMEQSTRSNLMYIFRRLKPTVALSPGVDRDWSKGAHSPKILAALCMHPIAYYHETWAGAMCPTDDVIAHLMLMRGDEHMLWRRCNQHPPYRPEAGL